MNKIILIFSLLISTLGVVYAQNKADIIASGAKPQILADGFSFTEGPAVDKEGNIYLTGKGVTVFNPQGEQIEHIPIDANWTANVCFGGEDMKTLFITASQCLYSLRMRVKGVR